MDYNEILDEGLEIFISEYETIVIKKKKKLFNFNEALKTQEKIEKIIKEKIEDDMIKDEVLSLIKKQADAYSKELYFWEKEFYQKGLEDGKEI